MPRTIRLDLMLLLFLALARLYAKTRRMFFLGDCSVATFSLSLFFSLILQRGNARKDKERNIASVLKIARHGLSHCFLPRQCVVTRIARVEPTFESIEVDRHWRVSVAPDSWTGLVATTGREPPLLWQSVSVPPPISKTCSLLSCLYLKPHDRCQRRTRAQRTTAFYIYSLWTDCTIEASVCFRLQD